jgi:hypothetical protein
MSNIVFPSSSSCIGGNRRCENVVASFTMIGFLLTSTKNKRVTLNKKHNIYIRKRFNVYILEIKVRIIYDGADSNGGTI